MLSVSKFGARQCFKSVPLTRSLITVIVATKTTTQSDHMWQEDSINMALWNELQRPQSLRQITKKSLEDAEQMLKDTSLILKLPPAVQLEAFRTLAHCLAHDNSTIQLCTPDSHTEFLLTNTIKLLPDLLVEIDATFLKDMLALIQQHSKNLLQKYSKWLWTLIAHQTKHFPPSLPTITNYCLIVLDTYRLSRSNVLKQAINSDLKRILQLFTTQLTDLEAEQSATSPYQSHDAHFYLTKIIFVYLQLSVLDRSLLNRLYSHLLTADIESFDDLEFTSLVYTTHQLSKLELLNMKELQYQSKEQIFQDLDRHTAYFMKERSLKLDRLPYILYSFSKANQFPRMSLDLIKRALIKNIKQLSIQEASLLNLSIHNLPSIDADHQLLKTLIIEYYSDLKLGKVFMPDLYYALFPMRHVKTVNIDKRDSELFESHVKKLISLFDSKLQLMSDGSLIRFLAEIVSFKVLNFKEFKHRYADAVVKIKLTDLQSYEFLTLGSILARFIITDDFYIQYILAYSKELEKRDWVTPVQKKLAYYRALNLHDGLKKKREDRRLRNPAVAEIIPLLAEYLRKHKDDNPQKNAVRDTLKHNDTTPA